MRTLFALAACLSLATSLAAQTTDRSQPPKPGAPPVLKLPATQKRTLSNGLPVWLVELHEVPVVQINLVVRAGSGVDPVGRFGLASLTAAMLDEGAGSRDALQIADAIDYLGASLSTSSTYDASTVALHVPVARVGDALPVMADVALRPTFPKKELDRLRDERLTLLKQTRDDPASLIGLAFPRVLYGSRHRYGTAMMGTADALGAASVEDLRKFHASYYQPSGAALIVVGDVTADALMPQLERTFDGWKAATPVASGFSRTSSLADAPQVKTREVVLIDKPGAAQSQIRIGWIGVARSTPDFFPLTVMNTVLGGAFSSRLNLNLREQHGYAYGASSQFDMRVAPGPFFAAAGVQTDKTSESLEEFFKELTGILKTVPPEELERAKNYVALRFPLRFETSGDIANQLATLFVYQLPDDYFSKYMSQIQAITAADVQRVAKRYIQPNRFAVVVIGDLKTIEPGIRALNLGPIRTITVDDVMKGFGPENSARSAPALTNRPKIGYVTSPPRVVAIPRPR